MVIVLDYLFGLPLTLGAVGPGGQVVSPADVLGRSHHPPESPAVVGGAVAIPGGDTARQDALYCASIKVCKGLVFLCVWTISVCQ